MKDAPLESDLDSISVKLVTNNVTLAVNNEYWQFIASEVLVLKKQTKKNHRGEAVHIQQDETATAQMLQ